MQNIALSTSLHQHYSFSFKLDVHGKGSSYISTHSGLVSLNNKCIQRVFQHRAKAAKVKLKAKARKKQDRAACREGICDYH